MSPDLSDTVAALRARLRPARAAGAAIGLVPTMGALHAGHFALIDRARRECSCIVVSIFVNPLQFDRQDDLRHYPRTLQADLDACRARAVNLVFAPSVGEMYPVPPTCTVEVARLADHLCGRHRPGHFNGVATVVLKLLQIVQPARAYFGEKDAQQLAVIRRLVGDLNVPVDIVEVPVVRETDGLAVSSRNAHLSPDERQVAGAVVPGRWAADGGRLPPARPMPPSSASGPPPASPPIRGSTSSTWNSSIRKRCNPCGRSPARCASRAPCGWAPLGSSTTSCAHPRGRAASVESPKFDAQFFGFIRRKARKVCCHCAERITLRISETRH